jgi:hypothetical protein
LRAASDLYCQSQEYLEKFEVTYIAGLNSANFGAWLSGKREFLVVLLSVLVQVPLAIFLGHFYDDRIFIATGYIVSSGGNPYQPINLVNAFAHPLLNGPIPRIGYPPPWPLALGLIFRSSYDLVPNVFFYNFAIKIPLIAANIGLAYLVRHVLLDLRVAGKKAKPAWLFVLFNPFILLTTSAWGQIDTIVALFCVGSFYLLSKNKMVASAFLLALSVSLKPITLPLIPLPFLFSEKILSRKNLKFGLVFLAVVAVFSVAPFLLFGWNLPIMPSEWNTQFNMSGGMTLFSLSELIQGSVLLPQGLGFLGFLWVPALIIGYYFVYRNRPRSLEELVPTAVGLTLIFFLTRSWLSEPNVNLILPLMLIAVPFGRVSKRSLHLMWVVPLAFMVLNDSIPQLFFLVYPSVLASLAQFDVQFGTARLIGRFAIALVWSIVAWRITVKTLKAKPSASNSAS